MASGMSLKPAVWVPALLSCVVVCSAASVSGVDDVCADVSCPDRIELSTSAKSELPLRFLPPCACAPEMASATVEFPTLALAAAIATEYARNDPTNKEQG